MSTEPNGFETPKTNWQAADVPTPTDFNRIEGNSQAIEEGSRTVDQTKSPSGLTGSLRQFLDWIPNRIKTILGTTNWYDSPPVTLTVTKNHIDNKSNPHNVTASQVGAATLAQLAAKVDKPSSATSGNIAVFDGGPGKIKDGGKKVADIPTLASGSYYSKPDRMVDKDTPLSISIPIGLAAKKGRLILQATGAGLYGIAFFNTVINEAMALDISSRTPTVKHRGNNSVVFESATGLCVRDVYISGNNLVLYITHGDNGSSRVTEVRIYWEVEK